MTLEHEDVDNLLDMAKHESHLLNAGEKFVLRDLFKGYQWDRINDTDRRLVGKRFWDYVHHEVEHIEPLDKSDLDQQKYKRK